MFRAVLYISQSVRVLKISDIPFKLYENLKKSCSAYVIILHIDFSALTSFLPLKSGKNFCVKLSCISMLYDIGS